MKKKISIVVPVYNGENFFANSLESLLKQTLKDLEIIIINDGSTDNTQQIIDFYQKQYPDIIKSKTVKNGGAGKARNYALDLAEGEYIGFFDSDDFIAKDMYEKMYNEAKKTDSDIVVCGYYVATGTSLRSYQKGNLDTYGKTVYEEFDMFVNGVPYLWNKIFRRDLIENNSIRFNDFRIFEDLEFTYRLFFLANKISKVDEPLYYYMKLNSQSLTAKFSDKFFDIMPAMDSLISFSKTIHVYEQFEDYLLYIYLNHMYIRMNANVSFSDIRMKFKYIDECFDYLNSRFPNWKEHTYYFENRKRNKKRYISRGYWKRMSLILKIAQKNRKLCKYFKKIVTILFKEKKGAKYLRYVHKYPVNNFYILLDSQHGEDLNGNMFYLLRELQKDIYKDYKVFVTASKKRIEEFNKKISFYNFQNVKLVVLESKEYLKILATAKFLFNDTSFPVYFIKRENQIYFNTWHGTPLKTLGKKTKEDFYNIGNLQKNFNAADYLLYPSEFMMEHMIEDYMLANISNNKIVLTGYPRNCIFFDENRRIEIRKKLHLEDYQVISYMPTWRGVLNNLDRESFVMDLQQKLVDISNKLKNNQIMYLNVHPYLKDYIQIADYKNIKLFPKEYETYDFLNISDVLITDYSSVFFDFACTKRKIILFAYDKEEYMRERGLYIDFDRLPFPIVETTDQLMEQINRPELISYEDFIKTFIKYDSLNVCEDICHQIILGYDRNIKLIDMPNNQKDNVLCVVNDLSSYFLNERFFSLLEKTQVEIQNFYLTYINANIYKHKRELLRLPSNFNYYGQLYKFVSADITDRLLLSLLLRFKFIYKAFSNKIDHIFENEKKRIFNDIRFDSIILFGEKKNLRLLLFAQFKGKKILYFPCGREFNEEIVEDIYKKYDQILIEEEELYKRLIKKYKNCKIRLIDKATSLEDIMKC